MAKAVSCSLSPRRLAPLVLFIAADQVDGWTTLSQSHGDDTSTSVALMKRSNGAIDRLWDHPAEEGWPVQSVVSDRLALSTEGLQGGITFAYDPLLCASFYRMFEADLWGVGYFSCDRVHAVVRMALDSWAINHERLNFLDVSDECIALRAADEASFTDPISGEIRCPLSEIWLTTTSTGLTEDNAASTVSEYSFQRNFRHTNGRWAMNGVYKVKHSTIIFNENVCWYLVRRCP